MDFKFARKGDFKMISRKDEYIKRNACKGYVR